MGVWRTPKEEEYATPAALVGRKVRVYFDGDCTYFEAQVFAPSQQAQNLFTLFKLVHGLRTTRLC